MIYTVAWSAMKYVTEGWLDKWQVSNLACMYKGDGYLLLLVVLIALL